MRENLLFEENLVQSYFLQDDNNKLLFVYSRVYLCSCYMPEQKNHSKGF